LTPGAAENPDVGLVVETCHCVVIPGKVELPDKVSKLEKLAQLLVVTEETVPGVGVPEQPNAHCNIVPLDGSPTPVVKPVVVVVDAVDGRV
jgi:hypothetical protein